VVVADNRPKPFAQKLEESTGGWISISNEVEKVKESLDALKGEVVSTIDKLRTSWGF
jgi:hypothetical protein